MPNDFDALRARLGRIRDLQAAAAVLEWDQETYLPDGAAAARALPLSTLHELAHEHFTDEALGHLLDRLHDRAADPDSIPARLVAVTRHDYERARRVPARLVGELAHAAAHAKQAWKEAREAADFGRFAPHLERLVALSVEKAEALGYAGHRYDALLDQFEPGTTTAEVARVFEALHAELVPIVRALGARPPADDAPLHGHFPAAAQWALAHQLLGDLGFDLRRGRLDASAHPFTTTFAIDDVRLTTRVDEGFFPSAFFGTLHEAGHGLYEQGIDPALARTPLADGASLGLHESQSRLWENLVGRSRPFWTHYYPRVQAAFPEALGGVAQEAFFAAVNRVAPSLIRVEADEVTYNLHIMLRFELETALLDGSLAVADLPAAWNDRMEAYLGLRPAHDAEGVLQDIHWALGAFGYFPTYALGTLMSAQLYAAAEQALPDLSAQIAAGRFEALLAWLRRNVHRWGRARTAAEILEAATGSPLSAAPWLAYVRAKYAGGAAG